MVKNIKNSIAIKKNFSKATKKDRIWELDFIRGICVLLMIWDHFMYNIADIFGDVWVSTNPDAFTGIYEFACNYEYGLLREIFHPIIFNLFFILCGISCNLSRNNLKRGVIALFLAFGITTVTSTFNMEIRFGVLHMLAFSILIYFIISKVCREDKRLISMVCLIAGMVIYFFIFMYASQVMKGVIEEKTNRIIEVLVSSVKPFQFLLGKIIGVATVGLVQFLIWVIFGVVLIFVMQAFFLPGLELEALRSANVAGAVSDISGVQHLSAEQLEIIQKVAMTIEPFFIFKFLAAFLFYFIGGYLLYASLFAAIGAAVDNETDSQQFLTPLSIVLVVGLYIGFAAMKSPESPLVFWSSLIPFTSPIVMLVRIPFGVPVWELFCSMALLVASFIFFTWLSGRIYRVGILMYGKKVTWKELYKWLKY